MKEKNQHCQVQKLNVTLTQPILSILMYFPDTPTASFQRTLIVGDFQFFFKFIFEVTTQMPHIYPQWKVGICNALAAEKT